MKLFDLNRKPPLIAFFVASIVGVVAFGCGGAGAGGGSTSTGLSSTTSTTGTTTTGTTTTGGPSVSISLDAPGQITQQSLSVGLTANTVDIPNAQFKWVLTGQVVVVQPGTIFQYNQTLPAVGSLQTASGAPFPTGSTTEMPVYVGNKYLVGCQAYDTVTVYAQTPGASFNRIASVQIPLSSTYTTLPAPIAPAFLGIALDKTTYKPGDTITATVSCQPGLNNTSLTVPAPGDFTPTSVTVNGSPVTTPWTTNYQYNTPAFTLVVKYVLPTTIGNLFANTDPADPNNQGVQRMSGPWIVIDGAGGSGGWDAMQPFFIHS